MSFELVVRFEGLFVFMPVKQHPITDIVFLQPCESAHKHISSVVLLHGDLIRGERSYRLTKHDVDLYDGTMHICGAMTHGNEHQFEGLPNLTPLFSNHPLIPGLTRPSNEFPDVCSARTRIADGSVRATKLTEDEWKLQNASGHEIPVGQVALEIEYARRIVSDTAKVVVSGPSQTDEMVFKPHGDIAIIQMLNMSPHNPEAAPGYAESPHFKEVFRLPKDSNDLTKYKLVRKGVQAMSLHIPCVGGCTC